MIPAAPEWARARISVEDYAAREDREFELAIDRNDALLEEARVAGLELDVRDYRLINGVQFKLWHVPPSFSDRAGAMALVVR